MTVRKVIVIDADANTFIMNADPAHWAGSEWEQNLMGAAPGVVNALRPHGDYAIIGPGGGVDVLRAIANGSHSVTGIEINPIIADTIMRGRYADFAYHLYQRPDVHMHVADGRSFIRNAPSSYDVVQMTLVDTWASTAAGAFALSENSLYTTEAFREYFEHLKPDGMIAVTRWEFQEPREALRVVSVAMQALHELGNARHLSATLWLSPKANWMKMEFRLQCLAKKCAFTAAEEAAVQQHLQKYSESKTFIFACADRVAMPFTDLIKSNDPVSFSKHYAYNVSPVTDNAPFFFFTFKPEQTLAIDRRTGRDGLESEPRGCGAGDAAADLVCGGAGVSDRAPDLAKGTRGKSGVAFVFCRDRTRLHSCGNHFYPALRSISRTSHLRADRGCISHAAVEWRGQRGFQEMDREPGTGVAPAADRCVPHCWFMSGFCRRF